MCRSLFSGGTALTGSLNKLGVHKIVRAHTYRDFVYHLLCVRVYVCVSTSQLEIFSNEFFQLKRESHCAWQRPCEIVVVASDSFQSLDACVVVVCVNAHTHTLIMLSRTSEIDIHVCVCTRERFRVKLESECVHAMRFLREQ